MLQHSVFSVADRSHGYCVDDNARALLFSTALLRNGETPLSETLTARFASFIQHAWNPDTGRFRNFMSYDRRWLEPSGSEDSHGRTLWALADHAASVRDPARRRWAAALFRTALPAVQKFTSPRAWAFCCWGWTPIAVISEMTLSPRIFASSWPIGCWRCSPQRNRKTGAGSRTGSPTTIRACRRR